MDAQPRRDRDGAWGRRTNGTQPSQITVPRARYDDLDDVDSQFRPRQRRRERCGAVHARYNIDHQRQVRAEVVADTRVPAVRVWLYGPRRFRIVGEHAVAKHAPGSALQIVPTASDGGKPALSGFS